MAKQRLFPKTSDNDKREPHDRFAELAKRVVNVPKERIDKREKQWREGRKDNP
jgi:hypothetical protein